MLSETNDMMSMTSLKSYIAMEKAFSSSGKAEWQTYSVFSTFFCWSVDWY